MRISAPTDDLIYRFGINGAIELLKNAGFDAYDITLHGKKNYILNEYFLEDDYIEKAKETRAFADSIGIICNQAHAPFSSNERFLKDSEAFRDTVRAMEVASILGAENIVVHPLQYLNYIENAEFLKQENLRFYRDLLPYAEKFGIRILTENMWQRNNQNNHIIHSVCSTPEEFCEYVDMINSDYLKGCLDVGHTCLVGSDTARFIKMLGKERLYGLHIHDNDCISDLHTLPFTCKIDFAAITDALGEIGYEGDFTFEAGHYLSKFPDRLVPSAARHMCEVGRYLAGQIERKNIEKREYILYTKM